VARSEPVKSSDAVNRLLRNFERDSVQHGNSLRLLESGPDALAAMEAAIAAAEHFVHLQTYIFRPDRAGQDVIRLLAATAERGVEVRLLFDSFGSWSLKNRHLAPLRAAGGRAAAFMPLLWRRRPFTLNLRNHRKLLLVDSRLAILGGRNIGSEYLTGHLEGSTVPWLDAMAEVQGPVVTRLHRVFVEDWFHAVEEDLCDARYFRRAPPPGRDTVGVVDSGPDSTMSMLPLVLLQLIGSARVRLDISTPYLIPSPVVQSALELAARRGVTVRIHTNGRPVENWLLYRAQRSYYAVLCAAGVRIYESRSAYNHTKLILVDDRYVCMGSPNLDWRSAELNFELAMVATRSGLVAEARAMFERRLEDAVAITQAPEPRLIDGLCRLASPLL
jgi:cardiolipin synthase